MSENKWHKKMDDWLKESMDDMPNPKISDWEAFEYNRQQTKKKKGLLWFSSALIVLLLISLFNNNYYRLGNYPTKTQTQETQNPKKVAAPSINEKNKQNIEPTPADNKAKTYNKKTPPETLVAKKQVTKNNVETKLAYTQATFNNHVKAAKTKVPAAQNWAASPFAVKTFNFSETDDYFIETNPENFEKPDDLVHKVSYSIKPEVEDSVTNNYAVVNYEPEEGLFEDDKISVSIGVYPSYTFRDLQVRGTGQNKVHKDYMETINSSEKGGMAFNVGAEIKYKIGKELFLGSGLYYTQTKITGAYDFEITEDPIIDPNTQEIIGYKPAPEGTYVNTGIVNSYSYLQIPLVISYQPWVTKKLRMVVEGGTSYLRFIKAEGTTLDYQNLRAIDLSYLDYNKNLFSINFKIGLNYYLNPQIALGLEPTFMYFSRGIYANDYPIYMVPWSIGVNFNMKIRLK